MREVAREIDRVVAGWVRGQAIVTTILAVLYAIGFTIVGMPLSLPIGLLVGALTVIPFVGTFVGAAIAALVTVADGGSMQTLGMVGGVILVLHLLEAGVLTPKIVGHRVGLSESGALFAVVAGGKLLGFVGVVLAVPIAATVRGARALRGPLLRAHRVLRPRVRCRRRDHAGDGADHAGRARSAARPSRTCRRPSERRSSRRLADRGRAHARSPRPSRRAPRPTETSRRRDRSSAARPRRASPGTSSISRAIVCERLCVGLMSSFGTSFIASSAQLDVLHAQTASLISSRRAACAIGAARERDADHEQPAHELHSSESVYDQPRGARVQNRRQSMQWLALPRS